MKPLHVLAAFCVLATLSVSANAENLVSNPTFSGTPYVYPGYAPVTGWTGTGSYGSNPSYALNGPFNQGTTLPTGDTTDGFLQVGGTGNSGLNASSYTTTLTSDLTAGAKYDYSFYVDVRGGYSDPTSFSLTIDGVNVYNTAALSTTPQFVLISGSFVDGNGSDQLVFNETGTGQDASVLLDNVTVSVAPTPEPSSLMLLGTGILGLAGAARRRMTR